MVTRSRSFRLLAVVGWAGSLFWGWVPFLHWWMLLERAENTSRMRSRSWNSRMWSVERRVRRPEPKYRSGNFVLAAGNELSGRKSSVFHIIGRLIASENCTFWTVWISGIGRDTSFDWDFLQSDVCPERKRNKFASASKLVYVSKQNFLFICYLIPLSNGPLICSVSLVIINLEIFI